MRYYYLLNTVISVCVQVRRGVGVTKRGWPITNEEQRVDPLKDVDVSLFVNTIVYIQSFRRIQYC